MEWKCQIEWGVNQPYVHCVIVYVFVYYMFALAYLCRCTLQLAQLWPNRNTQPTK